MRRCLLAGCVGLPLLVGTACWGATIEPIRGDLFISRGQGFEQTSRRSEAGIGDSVMVGPGGFATISYSDGCEIDLQPGAVKTIAPSSPCASRSRARNPLPLLAVAGSPDRQLGADPVIDIKGNSTSSAAKGTYQKNGVETESTADEVKAAQEYNMRYDGPSDFKADYNIVRKPDGSVDLDKSTVKFITVNYTHTNYRRRGGKLEKLGKSRTVRSDFTTLTIKITSVTLNKDGSVKSFKFSSKDWYPPDAPLGKVVINKGLSGEINLSTGKATFKASYQSPYDGVISTYDVTGEIKTPAPLSPSAAAGAPEPIVPQPVGPVGLPGGTTLLGASLLGSGLAGAGILLYESQRPHPASP